MNLYDDYDTFVGPAMSDSHIGRQQEINDAYQQGYQEGYFAGHRDGVNEEKVLTLKQAEYVQQLTVEKERFAQELAKQRLLIDLLENKIRDLEEKNAELQLLETKVRDLEEKNAELQCNDSTELRIENSKLLDLIDALKGTNHCLLEEMTELKNKSQKQTQEYADRVRQSNNSMIFMNTARAVLEELTNGRSPNASTVRQSFAEKYASQVRGALKNGAIKQAPDADIEFAKALPKTRDFIVVMLKPSK
jgi:hypothetical protein